MSFLDVIREILAWLWIALLVVGVLWAVDFLVYSTREAWKDWRAER